MAHEGFGVEEPHVSPGEEAETDWGDESEDESESSMG